MMRRNGRLLAAALATAALAAAPAAQAGDGFVKEPTATGSGGAAAKQRHVRAGGVHHEPRLEGKVGDRRRDVGGQDDPAQQAASADLGNQRVAERADRVHQVLPHRGHVLE